MDDYDELFKIILIGDSGVGKTNIISRFKSNEFNISTRATIGIDFVSKIIQLENGKRIKCQIWDTAGQERFRALGQAYYKNSSGCVIVFDITNEQSFANTTNWINQIRQESEKTLCILVGNKKDLNFRRTVSIESACKLAESNNCEYMECSAFEGVGIDEIFYKLCGNVDKNKINAGPSRNSTNISQNRNNRRLPNIRNTTGPQDRKIACC